MLPQSLLNKPLIEQKRFRHPVIYGTSLWITSQNNLRKYSEISIKRIYLLKIDNSMYIVMGKGFPIYV